MKLKHRSEVKLSPVIKNKKMQNLQSDIPKIFYAGKTGEKHEICIMCDDLILEYEHGYIIEKAFKRNEKTNQFDVIFEYALCTECQQSLSKEMSEKSMRNIQKYFQHYKSNISGLSSSEININKRLSNCMIKSIDVNEMNEYQIAGQFYKDKMIVFDAFPFAVGETAINEIQEMLSKKTKDFSDKFKDLILPPDVREKIPDKRIVFF